MDCHSGLFILSNVGYDELLGLFTISVKDGVVSEVYKGVDHCSKSFCEDETNLSFSAFDIELLKFFETNEIFSNTNQGVFADIFVSKCWSDTDINIRIEFFKLANCTFSSCLSSNISLSKVKVRGKIVDGNSGWIVKSHRFWTSQNKILGCLNSETALSNDQNFQLHQFAHCFHTKGSNLP